MGRIFDGNSRFAVWMAKAGDLIMLNVIFLLTSLPIVTIGASFAALYTVTLRMIKDEESYAIRSYLQAFKNNFKSATAAWVIAGVIIMNFWNGYRLAGSMMDARWSSLFKMVIVCLLFLGVLLLSYLFPMIAKFYNTQANYFKYSLLMAVQHFPYTVGIVVVDSIPFWCLLLGGRLLAYGSAGFVIIGFALTAYVNSLSFDKIFRGHMGQQDNRSTLTE